jgi:hypothetical protein
VEDRPLVADEPAPARTSARVRYTRAWTAGSALALLLFIWVVTGGSGDLFVLDRVGHFHDVQVRAWLDGHWDVPPEEVNIEGFVTDGRTYLYFGPVPALARLPLLAVTDRLDGRLTRLSLVLGAGVALAGCGVLGWRIRRLLRGDDEPPTAELVAVGAGALVLGAGSVLPFLGSRGIVYHETTLWAAALCLAAYAALLGHLADRRVRSLVLTTVLATLAMLTRGSVGVGPGVALGLVAAAEGWRLVRAGADRRRYRWCGALALAAVLPFAAFATVNMIKFRSLWAVPFDRQAVTSADSADGAARRAALADNGGSLFGFKFVPATALTYLRPDGVELTAAFPWVTFPDPAPPRGRLTFDSIDVAAGAPATMPALVGLSAVGLVGVVRRPPLQALVPVLGGAAVGGLTVLTIAFIAQRYHGDLFPFLAVAALAGLAVAPTLRPSPPLTRAAIGGLTAAAVWSVWANLALALDYQRLSSPNADVEGRAVLVDWQVRLAPRESLAVRRGDDPGPARPAGVFFVVGDCDGLYRSDGELWAAVERTPSAGHVRLRAILDPRAGEPATVLTDLGLPGPLLVLRRLDGDRARFEITDRQGTHVDGRPFALDAEVHTLDLVADARTTEAVVTLDGDRVLDSFYLALPPEPLTVAKDWARTVELLETPTPSCRRLVG